MPWNVSAARSLTSADRDWPAALGELERPPDALTVLGALPDLARAVAIVGTRRPDERALQFACDLARELAGAACPIVSGGALGVDSAAHRGALEAGGHTVAVLATGVERPYPASNRSLFQHICERGALVSEPVAGPIHAGVFLARNRLIAALAKVVIVVQAPVRSGALSTAAHAKRLGRELLAVPYGPWEPRGAGCLTLLATGAGVCRTAGDVLSLAALKTGKPLRTPSRRLQKPKSNQQLDEDERGVVRALAAGALSADEVCEHTGLSAPRVQRAILMLLLSKVIQEVGCGRYARIDTH